MKGLEELLECRSLEEVMIEVHSGSDREEESLVDKILNEEVTEVATLLSKQLLGPIVVLRGCAWDRYRKVCTTKVVQGQWRRDKESEGDWLGNLALGRNRIDKNERRGKERRVDGITTVKTSCNLILRAWSSRGKFAPRDLHSFCEDEAVCAQKQLEEGLPSS
jgi:hypothetical protein